MMIYNLWLSLIYVLSAFGGQVQARIHSPSKEQATAATPTSQRGAQEDPQRILLELHEQNHRRDQNCPALYPDPSKIQLSLTQDFLIQKVNVTKELSSVVSVEHAGKPIEELIEEKRLIYELFDGFSDGFNDQALVAKTKDTGICFATFQSTANLLDQGTIGAVLQYAADQWQNINPFTTKVGDDCTVRKGIVDAYNSTYGDKLRRSIDACVASCDGGCPLVLGGESNGGAAATVASIDLAHYNPEVITFAAPKAIKKHSPCTAIKEENHFRFINTGDGKYDCIVMQINIYNERHVGWPIFLDGFDFPLSSPGLSESRSRMPTTMALHEWDVYMDRINAMVNRNCFPVPVAKWPDGHECNYDDECDSLYCVKDVCKRGLFDSEKYDDDEP